MAGRQIIIRCLDGKWSASSSDRPEERFYGATMQEAIDRLKAAAPNDPTEKLDLHRPDSSGDE